MSRSTRGARAGNAAPIFVLAAPHSYGALIGAMIGCHPAAFALPELNLFVSDTLEGLWSEMADRGQVQIHGLLRLVAYLFAGEQTIAAVAMARRWLTRRMHWPTRRVFDELRAAAAPLRLVEKSRIYLRDPECLARIAEACPEASYVHVVRHPAAFETALLAEEGGDSLRFLRQMTRGASSGNNFDPQSLWLEAERRVGEFLATVPPERQVRVRAEEVLRAPERRMRALARALHLGSGGLGSGGFGSGGLGSGGGAIDAMLHPERSPFAGPGPVGAHLGDDPGFLHSPRLPPAAAPTPRRPRLEAARPWRGGERYRREVIDHARALGYA